MGGGGTVATEIADAYIALRVKMPGVQKDIANELGGVDSDGEGKKVGAGFSAGFAGAVAGAVAAVTSKAIDAVAGSINAAISRVDTINNFPKIMQDLGYSSDDAAESIATMSDRLTGLPTSLDAMAEVVQQLAPLTGGLGEATELSLALNNALLAGGKSTDVQANAMQQYTQMLAVGKVDMAAWQSLVTAMPGQMNQLSESLLGAGASQTDLYAALQDGTLGFADFNAAVLALNTEGADGFASFADQAMDATDGIATSQANLQTAITRGLANVIGKMQPQITALMGALAAVAGVAFGALADAIGWMSENGDIVIPVISGIAVALLVALAPAIWAAVTATWAFTVALLANPLTWIVIAVGLLVAAIVALAMNWDAVVAWISDVWGGFIGWITGVIEGFVGWWNGIWTEFGNFLGDVWRNIVAFVTGYINFVLTTISNVLGFINDVWSNVWNGILGFIKGIWNNIIGFIEGGVNGAIDLINGLTGGLKDVASFIGIEVGVIPHVRIPRLADGATVMPRAGGTLAVLAEAGRAESVVDTGLMNKALEQGISGREGGNVTNNFIMPEADVHVLAKLVAREQRG